jgi:hypothetical protein
MFSMNTLAGYPVSLKELIWDCMIVVINAYTLITIGKSVVSQKENSGVVLNIYMSNKYL